MGSHAGQPFDDHGKETDKAQVSLFQHSLLDKATTDELCIYMYRFMEDPEGRF